MNDLERQRQIESDAVRDGCVRWCRETEYQVATETKPIRNLLGISFKVFAGVIRVEQQAIKSSRGTKLPPYGLPLLSLSDEQLAMITLGMLLNIIAKSELDTCLAPGVTYAAFEIGQCCRRERALDRSRKREVNIADELRSRNRRRNASTRAREWVRKLDEEKEWVKNSWSYHLGEKLISLALRHALLDGKPIFELQKANYADPENALDRIGLSTVADEWIAEQTPEALDLFSPIYMPMIIPPTPWTSLSKGGYVDTPMRLLKRQTGKRAQRLLEKAVLSTVFSAVNALQNTAYRINKEMYRIMREAWDSVLPFFGLDDDADVDAAKRDRQLKGLRKVMAFRLSLAEKFLNEPHLVTPVGMVVIHENREPKKARIQTVDRKILIYQDDEKQKISATKQVNGIVAHLVHSMDAAHMMRTIHRLHAEGLRHFAMVHDSYGVHAADGDLLNRVLREEFVRIYSEPS